MTPPPCQPQPTGPQPCRFEGLVVTHAPCGCLEKHLHFCLSEADSAPDLCVRGPSADPRVRSCAACPLREPRPR